MGSRTQKLIVFSDLDGTLLDHETYSFEPAKTCLAKLNELDIPVILSTSKTHAEVLQLRKDMGLRTPAIVENGAAIFPGGGLFSDQVLKGQSKIFGMSYADIRKSLETLPVDLRTSFQGFGDLEDRGVARETGLPIEKARLARQRLASEPFLWSGSQADLERLQGWADGLDLSLLQGGRFYHVLSKVDKSRAIEWMLQRVQMQWPDAEIISIALGDGPNDLEMLRYCTHGVLVNNPKAPELNLDCEDGFLHTQETGPKGWAEAMTYLLNRYHL